MRPVNLPPQRKVVNILGDRPRFEDITSYREFAAYYWYRTELSALCRRLGIRHTGTKAELNRCIEAYFNGRLIRPQKEPHKRRTREISLDCPLLACNFAFNAAFRAYFSEVTGVQNFKFNADMATAWRKVKRTQDRTFTVRDLLALYDRASDYAKYDNKACEWNQFLKDFCADPRSRIYTNRLKAAAALWALVKKSTLPKRYHPELLEQNRALLAPYV